MNPGVLLVSPEEEDRRLLSRVLGECDCPLHSVRSMGEALRQLASAPHWWFYASAICRTALGADCGKRSAWRLLHRC